MTDDLTETLTELVARLDELGIGYMLVGSVAALAHGYARSTHDFDMVVDPDAAALRALVRSLPQERFYASPEALVEALAHETQFNIIDMHTGWKVDLIPRKRRAFSQTEFSRRRRLDVLGTSLWVASLEDTILAKLEWAKAAGGSERQREDVRALLGLGVATLDPDYVQCWVDELDLADEWARVRPASG